MAIEIAEAMKSVNLLELSEKTQHAPAALDENEKVVAAELDRAFRKIGETGSDPDHLIATLITRTITEDVINAVEVVFIENADKKRGEFVVLVLGYFDRFAR